MVDTQLKDWWGNPAIDYGDLSDMENKYADNLFVGVTNRPFGDIYVLYVCDETDQENASRWLNEFHQLMKAKQVCPYGAGIHWGSNVIDRKMEGFQGGAGYF